VRLGAASRRLGAVLKRPPPATLLVVTGIVVVGAAVRFAIASKIAAPQILCDEFIYGDVAKNVALHGRLELRDQPWGGSLLYPAAIAPGWFADSMTTTFAAVKAINVALMTLTAVPLYLWARRLVSPAWSLLPIVLYLLIPGFIFTGMVMSENAFVLTFVLACFAIAIALETPTIPRQLWALAAIGLACAARIQGLVLLAVLVTAVVVMAFLDTRTSRDSRWLRAFIRYLRPFWCFGAALAAAGIAYTGYVVLTGIPLERGLGPYEVVGRFGYSLNDVGYWTLLHLADLGIATAIVPVSAFIVLLFRAFGGLAQTRAERAYVAVTLAAVTWTTVQVGLFASRFAFTIVERYLFYVTPLLFLALAVWLDRGLPRPRLATAAASILPLGLLLKVPLDLLTIRTGGYNTLQLASLYEVFLRGGAEALRGVLLGGAALAGLLFAVAPRRLTAIAAPAIVAGVLGAGSYFVFKNIEPQATALGNASGQNPSWVENAIGRGSEAAFLYRPGPNAEVWQSTTAVLLTQFWNPNVRTVYNLGTPELCSLPETSVEIDRPSGRISGTGSKAFPRYVVAARDLRLVGKELATGSSTIFPLALYEIDPPLRIAESVEGVYGDGWMGSDAAYNRFVTVEEGGYIGVRVAFRANEPGVPGRVRIRVGPLVEEGGVLRIGRSTAVRRRTIPSFRQRFFALRSPSGPFRVEVHVEPTFSPSDFGQADTRQLGALVSFTYTASAEATR
jgi:hypothetical protein